jgi:hypothetical protein
MKYNIKLLDRLILMTYHILGITSKKNYITRLRLLKTLQITVLPTVKDKVTSNQSN